jgi:hypothetical protein
MKVPLMEAELSQFFGHAQGLAQRMISRYLQYIGSEKPIARSRPIAAESDGEQRLVQCCLPRQAENDPVTIQDAIDFMNQNGLQIDRFWVYRFIKRNGETFTKQTAILSEKERREVSEQNIKSYSDAIVLHLQKVPSVFVWDAAETRVGSAKRRSSPEVIAAKDIQPGSVIVADERDDGQLTLLTAISAFGDSIPPMFITKNKTFDETALADQ